MISLHTSPSLPHHHDTSSELIWMQKLLKYCILFFYYFVFECRPRTSRRTGSTWPGIRKWYPQAEVLDRWDSILSKFFYKWFLIFLSSWKAPSSCSFTCKFYGSWWYFVWEWDQWGKGGKIALSPCYWKSGQFGEQWPRMPPFPLPTPHWFELKMEQNICITQLIVVNEMLTAIYA